MEPATQAAPRATPLIQWPWIASRRSDLVWYIGSAGVGWLYLALVLGFGSSMDSPTRDPLFTLHLGSAAIPVTLTHVVYSTWAFGLDSPHLFATLARTFADPDERQTRRRALWTSWLFFFAGPAAVILPYAIGAVVHLPAGVLPLGGLAFDVFFRLWAYYHVVRQHWGFLALYRRKGGELSDPAELRADTWFFNLSLYLPILVLLTAPWYAETGYPPLGFGVEVWRGLTLAQLMRPVVLSLYGASVVGYVGYQAARWSRGDPRNGTKLLFLASVVPLHLLAFSSPLAVVFLLPIVTVGHNLQYHRIVWMYAGNKYAPGDPARYATARAIFRSVWVYAALGLAFTLVCYHGPWVDWAADQAAAVVDAALGGLTVVAGAPAGLHSLGDQMVGWFIMGWAMQHYYLDARIWRVGRDAAVARALQVAG